MRIYKNKSNEQIVQTPFGNIELNILKQILPEIGIIWNKENESWVFLSQDTGRKNEKNGKELWLPLKAYNFELAIHKAKKETYTDEEWRVLDEQQNGDRTLKTKDPSLIEIQRALSYGYAGQYLPAVEGEKSYGVLYRKYGLE